MNSFPHTSVFCRIGVSKIHGVGLFAIVDIPKSTVIFTGKDDPAESVPKHVVDALPDSQRKLYEDFAVLNDDCYICPPNLNELTVGWFFNHARNPNCGCRKFYRHGLDFFTLRDIKVGSELTLDYDGYERIYLDLELKRFNPKRKSTRK